MALEQAPDFTLRQLSYLLAAARNGTIAGAAAELHVSPSAVSDAITQLERIFQAQLCVRKQSQGLTLTIAGKRLASQARPLLAAAQDIEADAKAPEGQLAGSLTIGCYRTLAPKILPVLLDEFGAAHPFVTLEIREDSQDRLFAQMDSGEVDVVFVYETLVPGKPRRAKLMERPAYVVLSPDHPLAAKEALRLEELADHDMILLDSPPSREHTLSMFAERGVEPKVRHRTSSFEVVRTLVARGLGYGILVQRPENDASYEDLALTIREITPRVTPVAVEVVWPATHRTSTKAQALVDFAKARTWNL